MSRDDLIALGRFIALVSASTAVAVTIIMAAPQLAAALARFF